jgi:hypothetical protein
MFSRSLFELDTSASRRVSLEASISGADDVGAATGIAGPGADAEAAAWSRGVSVGVGGAARQAKSNIRPVGVRAQRNLPAATRITSSATAIHVT